MGADKDSLEIIMGAAKKDKRFAKMKGEDTDAMDEPKADEDEGGLEDVFSAKQAAAIRAYVDSCK